ncbi:hypothetical protein SAMD00019534_074340 [Acytostelium subglobosum LB1]|uniref:hypothetical protein n=1 Tax=Acytostelium subglobosum LB1 TaxID=1410327 RepID=UPI000644A50E|nr:hypothetical protein SAMD00019534_074340 [Acytostelium subglobosum LB1]GAM24259.1 hypothetical protein SAMD00019534_074340 [Acytostelium subglobosum LB1]|eukprot:XP_012752585.1 hypothetical protein SAMD00019534_074340 [Acytostelium subglobosum LB1]
MSLHQSAEAGNKNEVARLIGEGADVNIPDQSNRSPLHYAAIGGYTEIVALLLAKNATVNCQTNRGATPLHYASRSGRIECVALLLDNGADINCRDNSNATPLHAAITCKENKTALALINNYNADVNVQNKDGSTPLHLAASQGFRDVITCLIEKGAKIDARDNKGDTAFSTIPLVEPSKETSDVSVGKTISGDIGSLMPTSTSSETTSGGQQQNGDTTMGEADEDNTPTASLYSDITLLVEGGRKLQAHKCILAARSAHFRKLLKKHTGQELEIKDTSYELLQSIIEWIYKDSVTAMKQSDYVDLTFCMQLLAAAERYSIKPLVQQCEQFLIGNLSTTSVGSVWTELKKSSSIRSQCPQLTKHCAHLLCKSWNVLGVTKSVNDMTKQEILEMVSLLNIQLAEQAAAESAANQQPAAAAAAAAPVAAAQTPSSKTKSASTRSRASTTATPPPKASSTPQSNRSATKAPPSPPTSDKMDQKNLEICKNITQQIHKKKAAEIFHFPVDPVAYNIPNYFDIIKHPMDLSTVQKNLNNNHYKTIKEYAADMRLMFDNAMLFNAEQSPVWKYSKQLMSTFNKLFVETFTFETIPPPKVIVQEPLPAPTVEAEKKRKSTMEPSKAETATPTKTVEASTKSETPATKKYTDEDRKSLMEKINQLPETQLQTILEIIDPKAIKTNDEGAEIDMYEVGDANLAQLEEFINMCMKKQKTEQ